MGWFAVSCRVRPISKIASVGVMTTTGRGCVTVTVVVSVSPFAVVAVMVAVPGPAPVTVPSLNIEATRLSLLDHVTVWFVPAGATIAESCAVLPTSKLTLLGATVTRVATGASWLTVTLVLSVTPLRLCAVMVTLPALTPCTTPLPLTVATPVLLLDHVTVWSAVEGRTLA